MESKENVKSDSSFTNKYPEIPFKSYISFLPLVNRFWEKYACDGNSFTSDFAKKLLDELKNTPELLNPITDLSVIEKHRPLVDALLSGVFPPASREMEFFAAVSLLNYDVIYQTPPFERLEILSDKNKLLENLTVNAHSQNLKAIYPYLAILKNLYGININFELPFIYNYKDDNTRLDRYLRIRTFPWFMDVKVVGELRPLTEEDKKRLFDNLMNIDVWMEIIPPENFEIYGFMVLNGIDVTPQEVISSLKFDLIDNDSILSLEKFNRLQHKIRSLLKKPDLLLGLAALPGENNPHLEKGLKLVNSFILDESCISKYCTSSNSVYDKLLNRKETLIINDLAHYGGECTPVELDLIRQGLRNLTLAPLVYNGEIIGILELGSPHQGDLNEVNSMLLEEILPLFAMCVKRSVDDLYSKVQSIIKEKCTAIHPSVEWRFRDAALDYIKREKEDVYAEMEEIIFEGVYPLFGESDIRDSSKHRNASIQSDLIDNLNMAKKIIELSNKAKSLPILDELVFKINKRMKSLGSSLNSGDEAKIINFLHNKVEPLFEHLQNFSSSVKNSIDKYRAAIDSKLGFLYKKRKEFEDSIALINETISAYIDDEEEKAQKMSPHYFEKYKTDGVEHGIYIGNSLSEDGNFNLMYLKNLRLWQIMILCGVERKINELKDSLKVPLDTAHLILVQNTPLSIKFHYDEKKFDVDGTYNIRYEVMKKRIDKAEIRGSEERLTQPGKIAIVYSQESEAAEYKEYIEYLQSKNYLTNQLEELELNDLQGVHGLKALRVVINIKTPPQIEKIDQDEIKSAVEKMTGVITNN